MKLDTVPLTVRVHPSVRQAAAAAAAANDETISQVLRRALRDYIAQHAQGELRPIGRPRK